MHHLQRKLADGMSRSPNDGRAQSMTESDWFDSWAAEPRFTRKLIPLKPGEKVEADLLIGVVEGFRLETDAELRDRILEAMQSRHG
jgi:hypothetical protein